MEGSDRSIDARSPGDPRAWSPWLARAAIALTAAPLAWVGIRSVHQDRVLDVSDLWETTLATMSAEHGRQLVGAWSRVGVFHLGPGWFYWAAPFLAVARDRPIGLMAASAALGVVCLVLIGQTVLRAMGAAAACIGAVVTVLAVHQLGLPGLVAPWNPTVLILPTAAGLLLAARSLQRGTVGAAAPALVLGAFVAQAHLAAILVGLAIEVAALAGLVVHRRGAGTRLRPSRLGLVAACALLPWAPVALDQATGRGNAGSVVEYGALGRVDGHEVGRAPGYFTDESPGGAVRSMASIASLGDPTTASWAGFDLHAGVVHGPDAGTDLTFALLVLGAALGARPWRRRTAALGDAALPALLCRLGLAALALEAVSAIAVRHDYRTYLVASAAGVGMATWLGIALAAAVEVRARIAARAHPSTDARPAPALALAVGSVVAVALVATQLGSTFPTFPNPVRQTSAVDRLDRRLDRLGVGDGPVVVHDDIFRATMPASMQLVWELHLRGRTVAVQGRLEEHFGDWTSRAPARGPTIFLLPPGAQRPAGCRLVTRYLDQELCLRPGRSAGS